jgi:hypothetical protein
MLYKNLWPVSFDWKFIRLCACVMTKDLFLHSIQITLTTRKNMWVCKLKRGLVWSKKY